MMIANLLIFILKNQFLIDVTDSTCNKKEKKKEI